MQIRQKYFIDWLVFAKFRKLFIAKLQSQSLSVITSDFDASLGCFKIDR